MANSSSGDSVLVRLDRVLAAFGRDQPRLTSAQIARRTGLPPATAHRLCADLAAAGWLTRGAGGSYSVGTRLWELATRSAPETSLAAAAAPFLHGVQSALRQHVQLGRIQGDEVLFVQRLSQPGTRPISSAVAGRLPLHLSATGLVLLAGLPEAQRRDHARRVLERGEQLPQGGPEQLEQVLREIRASGHCVQTGNLEPDRTGIAVPVHAADGSVIAGLGIARAVEGPDHPVE
ncbi:IclR family transcriptional regulator [Kocuria palustris]|uniref:IclR family transcriptional regulator n=1 Tax=Kocuria palustris TaxID=71999 RepID=UPI0021A5265B|nr:IclR family transcriptional regulator [Kocuria palustris]MCT1589829.1 IclR family transcriptional regulator [Kocuria palustris]